MSRKASIGVAVGLVVGSLGWLGSGLVAGDGRAGGEPPPTAADPAPTLTRVRVQTFEARPYARELVLQGRTRASRRVDVRAETNGRVARLLFEPGARVRQGDVIAALDEGDRRIALDQALSSLAQAELEFKATSDLHKRGIESPIKVATARAVLDNARLAVARARGALDNLQVRAPFDAVLNARPVETGSYVGPGDIVATLVNLDPIAVEAQLSERDVRRVTPGMMARVRTIDGMELQATVAHVSVVADAATHTYRVTFTAANPDGALPDGMTAEAAILLETVLAHRVPASLLSLDASGTVGVKAVAEDGRVVFLPVTILAQDETGMWLGGLPSAARLIVTGADLVRPGDAVESVVVGGES